MRKETGWTGTEIDGTPLCPWEHDFTRAGVPVRQHEHIFVAHGRRPGPGRRPCCFACRRQDPPVAMVVAR
ncbi:hypothetical protein [Streptomyces sp. NRRL B-3648]|uniref:hypothetical protein n=1 Tax=Streptomyces sp. NRRL B-3648 TaxID=1519493 RepID=UPI001F21E448|nr:hypothetical protein [Streptomyces sp. NRRL B-3648]